MALPTPDPASNDSERLLALATYGLPGNVRPDVLVLDYGLPDVSGAAVLRKLRQDGFSLPVVIITGHADPNALTSVVREELIVLQKPSNGPRLVAALNDALNDAVRSGRPSSLSRRGGGSRSC